MKLLFLPLDSRPCTYDFPYQLAKACGVTIVRPAPELMDHYAVPSDAEKISDWLLKNADGCREAVIVVEQLVYGGLISSRNMKTSEEEAKEHLEVIRTLHSRYPELHIHLANTIMRTTISTLRKEDYIWWKKVAEYSQCAACAKQDNAAKERAHELENEIPSDVLNTFLQARKRNHIINSRALEMVAEGVAEDIVFLQEDSATSGLHKEEQTQIQKMAEKYQIQNKVTLHCGTDEAACALIGKSICTLPDRKIAVQWLGDGAEQFVAAYEDRPFSENLAGYMDTCGLKKTSVEETDVVLAIYFPQGKQADCMLEEQCTCTYDVSVLEKFCDRIETWIRSGKKVILLDIHYANGGETNLLTLLLKKKLLLKLAGYAGWNTATNALGTALGEILCLLDMTESERVRFLKERLLDDWIYQGIVRKEINRELKILGMDNTNISDRSFAERMLNSRMNENSYVSQILDKNERLKAHFPWQRTFEAGIRVIMEGESDGI